MNTSIHQMITFRQLFSDGVAFILCRKAQESKTSLVSVKDIADYIRLCIDKNIIRPVEIPDFAEIKRSLNTTDRIIEQSEEKGFEAVTCFDEDFPPQLRKIYQHGRNVSPLILYYKGNIRKACSVPGIAIIGTRRPTKEGVQMGEYFGNFFASKGFNIVSGLALGCDAAAHRGALAAGGFTTALVAHGLQYIFPEENTALAAKILAGDGVIITEYPVGTLCSYKTLIERCRLQAGLAAATVVIQTDDKKGGSMHAVRTAIENGKPVFAVEYKDIALQNHPMIGGNVQLLENNRAKPLRKDNKEEIAQNLLI
jgi:DNA processing protein